MVKSTDNKNINQYIKLADYKFFDYEIPSIYLDFIIEEKKVVVKSQHFFVYSHFDY